MVLSYEWVASSSPECNPWMRNRLSRLLCLSMVWTLDEQSLSFHFLLAILLLHKLQHQTLWWVKNPFDTSMEINYSFDLHLPFQSGGKTQRKMRNTTVTRHLHGVFAIAGASWWPFLQSFLCDLLLLLMIQFYTCNDDRDTRERWREGEGLLWSQHQCLLLVLHENGSLRFGVIGLPNIRPKRRGSFKLYEINVFFFFK